MGRAKMHFCLGKIIITRLSWHPIPHAQAISSTEILTQNKHAQTDTYTGGGGGGF